MYKHVHSKITYQLRVHQFTVWQVGKGGGNVIVINQVVTHHQNFNPDVCTSIPTQRDLPPEYEIRYQFTSGVRRQRI